MQRFHFRVPTRSRAPLSRLACAFLMLWLAATGPVAAAAPAGPTVRDIVEFTRIVQPRNGDQDELQSQVSPDGRRLFIVTRTADVRSDRNRFDVRVLDLTTIAIEGGHNLTRRPDLSVGSLQDIDFADPSIRDVRWADNGTLVMRARIDDGPAQVYRFDVDTKKRTQLTHEPAGVVSYALSSDLRRVVYATQVPNPAMPPGERSVVVGTHSFWSVKHGLTDPRAQQRRYQFRTAIAGVRGSVRNLGAPVAEVSGSVPGVGISPDGRWALLHRHEPARQLEWAGTYPLVAEAAALLGPAVSIDPRGYFSSPMAYVVRTLVAHRLVDGQEQVVVDAPDDALTGGAQLRSDQLWQDGGRSVVIAGTHLPRIPDLPQPPSAASHVIEYWPDTGQWSVISTLSGRLQSLRSLPGRPDAFAVTDKAGTRRFARAASRGWRELGIQDPPPPAADTPDRSWRPRIDESLNQPPDIVADGPSGKVARLTSLNPGFSTSTWGNMRPFGWTDRAGRTWDGGLMLPAGLDRSRRHPLVIQTYGFTPTRFYLDGANRFDGFTSGFPGRALMREGVLVLALPWRPTTGVPSGERDALDTFVDGVRGAIEALVADGIVDRDRIGIMGWSATGERVLNLVTFSDVPIRAASLLDGDANTLFAMTITYGFNDETLARKERTNGGAPFGDTRDHWVRNDPSMNTHCVNAALRIESYGPWVLNNWDVYALLRRQYKPVEMVVIPGGTHALSRPSERMISLQGNVDWHRFWLLGQERSEPLLLAEGVDSLQRQYRRWREMAELKRAVDLRPGCAPVLGHR